MSKPQEIMSVFKPSVSKKHYTAEAQFKTGTPIVSQGHPSKLFSKFHPNSKWLPKPSHFSRQKVVIQSLKVHLKSSQYICPVPRPTQPWCILAPADNFIGSTNYNKLFIVSKNCLDRRDLVYMNQTYQIDIAIFFVVLSHALSGTLHPNLVQEVPSSIPSSGESPCQTCPTSTSSHQCPRSFTLQRPN